MAGKKYKAAAAKVEAQKVYGISEAFSAVVETASKKFDETVDIAINLGVDPRKADQAVRGSVALPHGLGKNIRVAVFAKGDKAREAQEAGADIVGAEDLAAKIQEGFFEFDSVVASPDMMVQVGKVGKLLGPRGLMPSPKVGTVTTDIGQVVKSLKAGRAEFRVEKAGIVHAPVGKASFGAEKLAENAAALLQALVKARPQTSKGVYLKRAHVSCTMGPSVEFDLSTYR